MTPIAIVPFFLLLAMIATGPVLYPVFWHKHYMKIAPALGFLVVLYMGIFEKDWGACLHGGWEYVQFISLIGSLFVVSSGIHVVIHGESTPLKNLFILWTGALLANIVSTTGASMLLIRPYMRFNSKRLRPYHVAFFIFMVSNLGGSLTPIGDPPLFLAFLKGIHFDWFARHLIKAWAISLGALSLIFYLLEKTDLPRKKSTLKRKKKPFFFEISGKKHVVFLIIIVGAFFLDPKKYPQIPVLRWDNNTHHGLSFLRELIWVLCALLSYHLHTPEIRKKNNFSWEPIKEVAFLFIGIFLTMIPALKIISGWVNTSSLVQENIQSPLVGPQALFWLTGLLSAFLDNAPTFASAYEVALNSMATDTAGMMTAYAVWLKATALGAVFFGAMTYIGNGPNFMVRAIAEEEKLKMPAFFGYIWRYSLRYLLPVLVLVSGLIYFNLC